MSVGNPTLSWRWNSDVGCQRFREPGTSGSPGTWERPSEAPPPQPENGGGGGGRRVLSNPGLPQGRTPLPPHTHTHSCGLCVPVCPLKSRRALGQPGGGRGGGEAGRLAWVEESPNRLFLAREFIPTPSQNRKQPPRLTKGQGSSRRGWDFKKGGLGQPHPAAPRRRSSFFPAGSYRTGCTQKGLPWWAIQGLSGVGMPRSRRDPGNWSPLPLLTALARGLLTRELEGPEPRRLKIALASSQAIFRVHSSCPQHRGSQPVGTPRRPAGAPRLRRGHRLWPPQGPGLGRDQQRGQIWLDCQTCWVAPG